ncbi:VanZ family protein [Streptomyces ipomoeae]|uniref:VanZ family protein n=1 Tax=Streptomyces ipomoeae TaxID=103232 RepID=A0AAE8W3I7_9ACTN|nr:VanZ family protein [Streptomyces ipomoeae]TQE29891.1 VanZ family protein [Streptomyces ipomoeae]TQE32267.1 VanZ family protein [Streptomyces ipomoeae]
MARTTARSRSTTSGRRSKTAPPARRPLPLPLRLLVMALSFMAMVAFGAVLAGLTLQPSPASEALTHSNLRPGSSLELYWHHPSARDAVKQLGGNVLLGVPFGILLPVLAPGARGWLRVPTLTALMMLLVELVQGAVVTGRAFDIDDVILNTTGALLGYLVLGRRLGRAVHVPAGPAEPSAPAQRKTPRGGPIGRLRGMRRKGAGPTSGGKGASAASR